MTAKKADVGEAEVQKQVDQETEQGFRGEKADPLPNDAYSIKTGPESPTIAEQEAALAKESD